MCRFPIAMFPFFSICLLISFLVPRHVFRKPCLMDFIRLAVVGLNSAACKYCAGSGFYVCARMLFIIATGCWFYRGASHIPFFLFLVPLIIFCPFYWTDIYCFSSLMVHPSSHNTSNKINVGVFIFGKIGICLACLLRPYIWSVAMCEYYIVLPSGSLAIVSFEIIIGFIVVVNFFARCIFAPESEIASML